MKNLFFVLSFILSLNVVAQENKSACKNGSYILEQSQQFHDPHGHWQEAELSLHIQEPRIQNPGRYSIVNLNNASGYFKLDRSRDAHISSHIVAADGTASVLWNGSEYFSKDLIEKYRLQTSRCAGYQQFYQLMYGLPMTLDEQLVKTVGKVETIERNGQQVFAVDIELKEAMISKHWRVLIAVDNFQVLGLELFHPDDPTQGEILTFDDLVEVDGIQMPRIRHWYDMEAQYLGSDIIVKEIK
jgi:hypothetical protein